MPRAFAVVVILGALGLVVWAAFGRDTNQAPPLDPVTVSETVLAGPPPILAAEAPLFTDLDGWLQSDIDELADLRGQVVVVQFWTFGCINCKRTLANLADMYTSYRNQGFEIVGVHAPEFEFEKDPESIAAAAVDLGVTWPIALDTNKTNFGLWQGARRYWPRTYVLDRDGQIRFDHIGEGKYEELQATVAYLLAEEA